MKYISTHFGHRYLTSEMSIASGLRDLPAAHWTYAAKNAIDRYQHYRSVSKSVDWLITPAKVTSHLHHLRNYLPPKTASSWGFSLIEKIEASDSYFPIFFNPSAVSSLDNFFKYDSHWTSEGSFLYFEPWLRAKIGIPRNYEDEIDYVDSICLGNCVIEEPRSSMAEKYKMMTHKSHQVIFQLRHPSIPDFSVIKTVNPSQKDGERALIIHSSAYEFARGFASSLFKETIEVFSPYIPKSAIEVGEFDRVLIVTAERNASVVYDGLDLTEKIKAAISVEYIQKIANDLKNINNSEAIGRQDKLFLRALGESWETHA